jgi:hypothetical protein
MDFGEFSSGSLFAGSYDLHPGTLMPLAAVHPICGRAQLSTKATGLLLKTRAIDVVSLKLIVECLLWNAQCCQRCSDISLVRGQRLADEPCLAGIHTFGQGSNG